MAVSKQIVQKQSISDDEELDIGMKQTKTKLSQVLKESITGKAIVILLGSIVIGYIIGKEGFEPISIVFDELFTGAIVIFMIEMGIIAGQRLEDIKKGRNLPDIIFYNNTNHKWNNWSASFNSTRIKFRWSSYVWIAFS